MFGFMPVTPTAIGKSHNSFPVRRHLCLVGWVVKAPSAWLSDGLPDYYEDTRRALGLQGVLITQVHGPH